MADALVVTSVSLVGLQIGIFVCLLGFCACKIVVAQRVSSTFMVTFYALTFLYILCELAIQLYQLVMIIINGRPDNNAEMVLALNIFCMIVDLHILLMLTLYWNQVQGSFVGAIAYTAQQNQSQFPLRIIPSFLYLLCYSAYFIYLLVMGILTTTNNQLNPTHKIILYIIAQSFTGLLLLLCLLWQGVLWCKLESMMGAFQKIVPVTMKKTRITAIFWGTVVFNIFRTCFISYLVVLSQNSNYQNLIIALNSFTLTATVPILFYLFGFKIGESEVDDKLIGRQSDSSRKTSSAHETELSHKSQK